MNEITTKKSIEDLYNLKIRLLDAYKNLDEVDRSIGSMYDSVMGCRDYGIRAIGYAGHEKHIDQQIWK